MSEQYSSLHQLPHQRDRSPLRWGREVTHDYTKPGAYTVTLSVQGDPSVGDATAVHKSYIHVMPQNCCTLITGLGADPGNPDDETVRGFFCFNDGLRHQIDAARRGFRGGNDSGDDDDDDGHDTPAGHRKALIKKLDKAAREVAKAERETEPEERDEHFAKALKKKVLARMDGYLGGDPTDDWILTQEHQALAAPLVYRLINAIQQRMSPPTGTPPVL